MIKRKKIYNPIKKMKKQIIFVNMPIEINYNEYLVLAKTLYASLSAMMSKNKMIHIIDVESKKVYGFDEVKEKKMIKEYGSKKNHHLLQIVN